MLKQTETTRRGGRRTHLSGCTARTTMSVPSSRPAGMSDKPTHAMMRRNSSVATWRHEGESRERSRVPSIQRPPSLPGSLAPSPPAPPAPPSCAPCCVLLCSTASKPLRRRDSAQTSTPFQNSISPAIAGADNTAHGTTTTEKKKSELRRQRVPESVNSVRERAVCVWRVWAAREGDA